MSWFHSLYVRLALGLVALLFLIGLLYTMLNAFASKQFEAKLNQDLHRNLAHNLVADKNLVAQGKLNQQALKDTFSQYMVVNPSIEIYLLDLNGKLLAYSVDAKSVMRNQVSLAPIKAFLSGKEAYPLGDDPRSHDKQKAFSVTQVPSNEAPEGYLYVVLRGEQYDALESMAFHSFWLKTGLWSMLLSLFVALLAGLFIFYWLTNRLRKVSKKVEQFGASDSNHWQSDTRPKQDEISQLEYAFSKMAERIESQLAALSNKDNQRRQLVAQMSHDLRTPLAAMLGYVESLRLKSDSISKAQQEQWLEVVYRQGLRLNSMVESLFELSSLEASETKTLSEPFVPTEVLYDVRQKHLMRAQEMKLDIQIEHPKTPAFVMGDLSVFERVLDNLMDNALAHAKANSCILMRVQDHDDSSIISVSNEGKQINEDELSTLFEPFFRAKGQSADKRHAGLGLAISKRLMESMNGTITVKNSHNGVVFSLGFVRQK